MPFTDRSGFQGDGRPARWPGKRGGAARGLVLVLLVSGIDGLVGAVRAQPPVEASVVPGSAERRERATEVLRAALQDGERWTRLRAAERLLAFDLRDGVVDTLHKELKTSFGDHEYRIGVWQVLTRASFDDRERERWTGRIVEAFLEGADDRIRARAAAALAKLGHGVSGAAAEAMEGAAREGQTPLLTFARWVLANRGRSGDELPLVRLLSAEEMAVRADAAYAIRHLRQLSPAGQVALSAAARQEPDNSGAKVFLVSAAAVHAPAGERDTWQAAVRTYAARGTATKQAEACTVLAEIGTSEDLGVLMRLMEAEDGDVRVNAATAVLRIGRRVRHRMQPLDWIVIGLYCLGMIAVGAFFATRSKNAEDYLLGGRRMNPVAVGVSLFATLLSTISYLSWPGEMIRYGPLMMMGCVASFPLIAIVVGWFMIPFIMRLRVTTAYELLDADIGGHVRLLGSFLFLLMRLIWMAVIVYVAVGKLLVPLMGLDEAMVPYISAILGVIVVIYTSMGGMRAVVFTDVLQTLIMFGGGILTLVVITSYFGGVGGWWPKESPAHWPEMTWGVDPTARTTFIGTLVAIFTWYICVSCSDQMAIQRYLSTRDVRAARVVLVTSLSVDAVVTLFLSFLGLALLAYFRAQPHLMPDGRTILDSPDQLFPQFMVLGLPAGLSGLLVAGLLAAAMSSLSSGINSSCSVIMSDLLWRRKHGAPPRGREVNRVRLVSAVIGGTVVLMSTFVGLVRGNLMEVAFKLVNLFTAPLAGIFLMAMFVKRSNPFGTYVGFVFGLATVVLINYWEELTGTPGISFFWAMPVGLVVQVVSGTAACYLPVGRNASPPVGSSEVGELAAPAAPEEGPS